MIWPVSDCSDPVELIVIPDYHANREVGYVTIQTGHYFAWWHGLAPGCLRVSNPEGDSRQGEWLELRLDARMSAAGAGELLGPACGAWTPTAEYGPQHVVRGEGAELRLSRAHQNGLATVALSFRANAITYRVTFSPAPGLVPYRLAACSIAEGTWASDDLVFDPQPQISGAFYHRPGQLVNHDNIWLTPAPFAYAFGQRDGSWSIAAVEAPLRELTFSRFSAQSVNDQRLRFVFDYGSLPLQTGEFTTPALVWRFGYKDEFAAMEGHASGLVEDGVMKRPQRDFPSWWRGRMVCGWHRQVECATLSTQAKADSAEVEAISGATGAVSSGDYANQAVYEEHVAEYEKAGIPFDILTIDMGWSRSLGDWSVDPQKWPDLRGFIESQHQKGRHVLLWICGRNPSPPQEETVGDLPHNPAWLARMKASLQTMLGDGPGCLNADGLKFDFTGPRKDPRETPASDELHGYLYLYELYRVVSEAARCIKPEALLDFQAAHPQFASLHGMTRLNDFFISQPQALRVMRTRARIAKVATFGGLIDTDCPAGLAYLRHSREFGNQSLYLTHAQLGAPAIVAAVLEGGPVER